MGCWDEYCTICGGPPCVPLCFDADAELEEPLPPPPPNPADYTWLDSFIGISNKEELISLGPYNNSGSFEILQPDMSSYSSFYVGCHDDDFIDGNAARGYGCHVTCYNLLQQELNYTLKHADVLPLLNNDEYDCNSFSWSDYGGLKEYQEQSFGDVQLVRDGKLWMIEDPSRDGQNKERILQLWRPLVESGFKRPDADDGSSVTEIAETNMDASRA